MSTERRKVNIVKPNNTAAILGTWKILMHSLAMHYGGKSLILDKLQNIKEIIYIYLF